MNKSFAISRSATCVKILFRGIVIFFCIFALMAPAGEASASFTLFFKAAVFLLLSSIVSSFFLLYSYLKFDKRTLIHINTDKKIFRYIRGDIYLEFSLDDIREVEVVTFHLKYIPEQFYKIYLKEKEMPLIITGTVCGYLNFLLNKPCGIHFTHSQLTIPKERYDELLLAHYVTQKEEEKPPPPSE